MYIFFLIVALLLYEPYLSVYIDFSYTDEFVVLICGLILGYQFLRRRKLFFKDEYRMLLCIGIFWGLGIISVFKYNYQNDIEYGFLGSLFSVKAFIAYFGIRALFKSVKIKRGHLRKFLLFCELNIIIGAIVLILDQYYGLFPHLGVRFGLKCSYYIFEHPSEVACFAIVNLLVCIFLREYLGYREKILRNYIPAIIMIVISGRYKALGFLLLFLIVRIVFSKVRRFKLRYVIAAIPAALLLAEDQIVYYFGNTSTARGAMYYTGIRILRDHFPFGSGFSTFGTSLSGQRYSPLYLRYGISRIWGLTKYNYMFMADAMWPAVMGETGFFGLLSILVFFCLLFKMLKNLTKNKHLMLILYCTPVYFLIESVADSIFISPRGVLIFSVFAFFVSLTIEREKESAN